ncbi:EamA family transporter [Pseudoflavonifractor hominis]|uniref:EamA family transporter n=1 Tax=Pseudoflavonifractor hominis TaxID=2763059 RepID=A0ABR7HQG9_9FIRM|nr:EamA family transporter [Pseudoflavonifractor hominis]MBC5729732.1 EamA family transporter [Pseudoflavonifractor hominis]
MNSIMLIIPALLSSACNSIANALWKTQFLQTPLQTDSLYALIRSVFHWRIMGGVVCYGISMLLFFYLLSHYKLSQVVPFLATTYIFNFIIAGIVFHEVITWTQLGGIALIIGGVILSNLA